MGSLWVLRNSWSTCLQEAVLSRYWLLGVTALPEVPKPLWLPLAWRREWGHWVGRGVDISCTPPSGSSWYPADIEWLQIILKWKGNQQSSLTSHQLSESLLHTLKNGYTLDNSYDVCPVSSFPQNTCYSSPSQASLKSFLKSSPAWVPLRM